MRPGREDDSTLESSSDVKNMIHVPQVFIHNAVLKHRNNARPMKASERPKGKK